MTDVNAFAYYLYGITARSGDCDEPLAGVGAGEPVSRVTFEDLQAVVSRVPLADFSAGALQARMKEAAWLEGQVLAHERVIRVVFARRTIIPIKFGTLLETKDAVTQRLQENAPRFRALLQQLAGKQEWGVKIFANRAALKTNLVTNDATLARQAAALAKKRAGAAYLYQKKLDEQIAQRVEQALLAEADAAYIRLLASAEEGCLLRLLPPELTGRSGESNPWDVMILNAAFLVKPEALIAFIHQVERLQPEHDWWQIEWTGPWAPYNFLNSAAESEHV